MLNDRANGRVYEQANDPVNDRVNGRVKVCVCGGYGAVTSGLCCGVASGICACPYTVHVCRRACVCVCVCVVFVFEYMQISAVVECCCHSLLCVVDCSWRSTWMEKYESCLLAL